MRRRQIIWESDAYKDSRQRGGREINHSQVCHEMRDMYLRTFATGIAAVWFFHRRRSVYHICGMMRAIGRGISRVRAALTESTTRLSLAVFRNYSQHAELVACCRHSRACLKYRAGKRPVTNRPDVEVVRYPWYFVTPAPLDTRWRTLIGRFWSLLIRHPAVARRYPSMPWRFFLLGALDRYGILVSLGL